MHARPSQWIVLTALVFHLVHAGMAKETKSMREVAPGVWKVEFGKPESITPGAFKSPCAPQGAFASLPAVVPPFAEGDVRFQARPRGCTLELPLGEKELIYGMGMQINSMQERGLRKQLVTNCVPVARLGYTHAPVPFYVSTAGYGVYVDTARYATLYCGTHRKVDREAPAASDEGTSIARTTDELYRKREAPGAPMLIDIPAAQGVDVYIFGGPTLREAVQRYNLFSGGGCLPPLWGLGVKYRVRGDFDSTETLHFAKYFREKNIPCDVLGLEPGWQTHTYSCTYVWSPERFPDPDGLLERLHGMSYQVNLWEHAYVHPDSPLYEPLKPLSGDYPVWNGLVPDFTLEKARAIFSDYHERRFVDKGVSGFKCDECDNANFFEVGQQWGFPEASAFPSGADGEQMHQLLGLLYQKTFLDLYRKRNRRTWLDVRASGGFAAPLASTLYSDIYAHDQYVRMILTAGFSGLLWSPEVRQCGSLGELVRRAQTSVLSAQVCFNSWMIKNPPWLQFDMDKNNKDELLRDAEKTEGIFRRMLEFRMSLIPYLYAAFARYRLEGIPPFRALVMDYPSDPSVQQLDSEFMIGDNLLAAPFIGDTSKRDVYLPAGTWYCFWTGHEYEGDKTYPVEMGLEQMPLFVREGSILPLAKPVQCIRPDTVFEITCRVYGDAPRPAVLYEDDGVSHDFDNAVYNTLTLSWRHQTGGAARREGKYKGQRYSIGEWQRAKPL